MISEKVTFQYPVAEHTTLVNSIANTAMTSLKRVAWTLTIARSTFPSLHISYGDCSITSRSRSLRLLDFVGLRMVRVIEHGKKCYYNPNSQMALRWREGRKEEGRWTSKIALPDRDSIRGPVVWQHTDPARTRHADKLYARLTFPSLYISYGDCAITSRSGR